jgi:hypothetical protein
MTLLRKERCFEKFFNSLYNSGFVERTLSGIPKTRPGCLLPDYGIKENKVGFRGGAGFL